MKVTVLGGGGFRTPLVVGALLTAASRLRLAEVVLHDVSGERLALVSPVLDALAAERGVQLRRRTTTDLDEAVDGARFVLCAIRVGGLEGRVADEEVPVAEGVVGQETTGPGGVAFALRTLPAMTAIAAAVARRAPQAWFVNFTNPAGLVTEALRPILGDRVIGICDSPPDLFRGVARAVARDPADLDFDYFGLNHLGWLRAATAGGEDLLPSLLRDDEALASVPALAPFSPDWLRLIGMAPNEYLWYWYESTRAVEAARRSGSRAAELLRNQAGFYEAGEHDPRAALRRWRRTVHARNASYMADARGTRASLADREDDGHDDEEPAGGYEGVAVAAMEALAADRAAVIVLNTANRGAMPWLDDDAVVEVPCDVDASGVRPRFVGDVPLHARALVEATKEVERTAIAAAADRSAALALRALALHPLVPSVDVARRILAGYRRRLPALADLR